MKKRSLAALLMAAAMTLSLAACGGAGAPAASSSAPAASSAAEEPAESAHFSVAALKGPTAMGLVKLMEENDARTAALLSSEARPEESGDAPAALKSQKVYSFTLAASPDEVTPKLIQGELDMACVPANLAAVLYGKTEGQVEVLAVNTLGVLYIVENGNAVQSLADLKGMTVAASGKGSTPEYALRYLLEQNGVDPDRDVTIDWKSEHSECVAALASGAASVALLPQPFVTVAQSKLEGLRVALDLTEEWDRLDNGSGLITGVIVARRDAVEKNPGAVQAFLQDYAASVDWVNANTAAAAELIGSYGIVDAAVAEKALPACNIVCLTGEEMHQRLSGYLSVLCEQNPQAVGGALPEDDFYFGA